MSQQQRRPPWEWAVREQEQLLDGRLLDSGRIESVVSQAAKFDQGLAAVGPSGVPPAGLQERLSRAARLAGEQLRQLEASLSALSIAGSMEWYGIPEFSALPVGLTLAMKCLHLLKHAQLGGQDLFRLAAGLCALLFGSGQRMLRHAVSVSADASETLVHLQPQALGLQRLVSAVKLSPTDTSRAAIASTLLKPSSLLPWMGAAAAALRHAHNQLKTGAGTSEEMPVSLAELGSWAGTLTAVAAWVLDAQKAQLGTEEADLRSQMPLLDMALAGLDIQLQLAEEGFPAASAAAADGSDAGAAAHCASGSRGSGSGSGGRPWGAPHGWQKLCSALYVVGFGQCHKLAFLKAREEGGSMQLLAPAGAALRLLLAAGPELQPDRRVEACLYSLKLASMPWSVRDGHLGGAAQAPPPDLTAAAGLMMPMAPHIAAAVRLCSQGPADCSSSNALDVVAALFYGQQALEILLLADPSTSADQLAERCHAADACLRLLPVLDEVHAAWIRSPTAAADGQPLDGVGHVPQLARSLAAACLCLWSGHVQAVLKDWNRELLMGELSDEWAAAMEPLWQLHSTVVRLLHWAAVKHSQHTSGTQPDNQLAWLLPLLDWRQLAHTAVGTLRLAVLAGRQATHKAALDAAPGEQLGLLDRRMQAICAAHAQLAPVLADKLGIRLSPASSAAAIMKALVCLGLEYVVPFSPPPLVDPQLEAAFTMGLRHCWETSPNPGLMVQQLTAMMAEAHGNIFQAVLLLTSGLLELGLELGVRAGLPHTQMRVELFTPALAVCAHLQRAGAQALGAAGGAAEPSSSSSSSSHLQEAPAAAAAAAAGALGTAAALQQLPARLDRVVSEAQDAIYELPIPDQLARFRQELLPLATQLAWALQEHWSQPEQQAAARLEAARVASTRSCAYLRCANLLCGGGPAARQGEGSKRCSACRTAWYCSAECSRADWGRGGWHKQACKALAAAQQAASQDP